MRIGLRTLGRWSLLSIECYLNVRVSSFLIRRVCLDMSNSSGRKGGIRFPHQRIWRRIELEGLGRGYSLRSDSQCTTLPHLCHHAGRLDGQSQLCHFHLQEPL